ncbi:MAG: hypothetical protein V4682_02720 [Patescibacteria group bacterium]
MPYFHRFVATLLFLALASVPFSTPAQAAVAGSKPLSTTPALSNEVVIVSSPENPDWGILEVSATKSSEEYTVFVFEIENHSKDDVTIRQLSIATQISGTASTRDVIRTAEVTFGGDEYAGTIQNKNDGYLTFSNLDLEIYAGETDEFELLVSFKAADAYAQGSTATFSIDSKDVMARGEKKFTVSGAASSASHTLSSTGIVIEPVSTSESVIVMDSLSSSYGTFQIKFDVTAIGADAFIPQTIASKESGNVGGATFHFIEETSPYAGTSVGTMTSTADIKTGYYVVGEGETETFTATMIANPTRSGMYAASLDIVRYGTRAATTTDTYYLPASDYNDFVTKSVSIPDAPTPQATVQLTAPNGGESFVAGSGTSVPVRWTATNVPAGATACTTLLKAGSSGAYAFPGTGSCTSARNGTDSHTGTLIRNAGYDLGPGTYTARVQIVAAPSGGKDGAVLAEDRSDTSFILTEAVALDTYRGYMNGRLFIETKKISESNALSNCTMNATNNPTASFTCTWGTKEIYRRDAAQVKTTTTPKPEVLPAVPTTKTTPVKPEVLPAVPTTKKVVPVTPEVLPAAPTKATSPAPEVLPTVPTNSKTQTNTSMFEANVLTGVRNVFNAIFGK